MRKYILESNELAYLAEVASDNLWNPDNEDDDVRFFPPILILAWAIKCAHLTYLKIKQSLSFEIPGATFVIMVNNEDDPINNSATKGMDTNKLKVIAEVDTYGDKRSVFYDRGFMIIE